MSKTSNLVLGPTVAAIALFVAYISGMPGQAAWTMAIVVWVAWWWISEALPLPVTSLLPFILLPAGGVLDMREASGALGIILLSCLWAHSCWLKQ